MGIRIDSEGSRSDSQRPGCRVKVVPFLDAQNGLQSVRFLQDRGG